MGINSMQPKGKPPRDIKVVSGQSAWNRSVRNVSNAMIDHLGGNPTEPEKMLIRRVAVYESEMRIMELAIAKDRHLGVEPSEKYIDLYTRLANGQKRLLEGIGMKAAPRDVTPDLKTYLDAKVIDSEA